MRLISYLRVSSDQQSRTCLGIAAQRAAVRSYCEQHGHEIVAEHVDDGISGGRLVSKRQGLSAAIAELTAHRSRD